jgi:hypothetical protein
MGVGLVVCATTAVAATGCGHPAAKFAQVKAGELPSGETWVGVYYNPVYGYLHLIEQDGNIVGRWKRTDGSHWGELSGTVDGNVMHFTWTEHKYGGIGPSADSKGSGQFVFKMGENDIPELGGQYALEDSEKVGDWHCVKQKGMKADPSSINGSSVENTGVTPETWK